MKKPLVSILVLNYNHKEHLKSMFDSVKKLNKKCGYESFLVDNASSDGSVEYVKKNYPRVTIVQTHKNLGTPGHNVALPLVKGDYIVWVGVDSKFHPDALVNMVKVFDKEPDVGAIYPNEADFSGKSADVGLALSRILYFFAVSRYKRKRESFGVGPGIIRKNVLDKIKYIYDPDYFYGYEDVDLALRIRLLGLRVVMERSAVFYHRGSISFKKRFSASFRVFLGDRNSLITFFKVLELRTILLYLPYNLLFRFFLILKDVLTGKLANSFARIKAIAWVAFHFSNVMKRRRFVQKLRAVPDSEVFKPIANERLFVSALFENIFKRESFDIYTYGEKRKEKVKMH